MQQAPPFERIHPIQLTEGRIGSLARPIIEARALTEISLQVGGEMLSPVNAC